MPDENSLKNKLKKSGYRLTKQRKAIIEVLLEFSGHFLSAQEIFLKVKAKHPQTNFSTIYRNLETLENLNIIHKTNLVNDTSFYELISNENHHHHIICKGCGKTESINFCPLDNIKINVENPNFTLTDHKFELYGYCKKCLKT
ncbi:MAG TPA: transcriptional repressor [Clostridia bacterium]|nr:transcriptional repressor [Clostridia bacterium]